MSEWHGGNQNQWFIFSMSPYVSHGAGYCMGPMDQVTVWVNLII